MVLISFSLALLAIASGMFLLSHTKKEGLGPFFKLTSYFIILCGFLCLICLGSRCMMRCGKGGHCGKEERCEMEHRRCMRPGMEEGEMMMHGEGMKGKCCKGHGMEDEGENEEDVAADSAAH